MNINNKWTSNSKSGKILYLLGTNIMNEELYKLIDSINSVSPTWILSGFIISKNRINNSAIIQKNHGTDVYMANNLARSFINYEKTINILLNSGIKFCNLIHPSIDMNMVYIGTGCIMQNGILIGSNSRIGNYVTIRLNTMIGNNVSISDHVFIGPSASIGNNVVLEKNCTIGLGSIIYDGITIGRNATVGAGAVVTDNIPPNQVVVGIPASPLKK